MEIINKIKFFALAILFVLNVSAKDIMIISDLDDTIKITETNRPVMQVINGFFTTKVFAGMPELYEHMQNLYVDRTVVLTSSPTLLNNQIEKLFDKHNMKVDQLITRKVLGGESDGPAYKYKNIVAQLENHNMQVILIGDDSGEDHEIYHKVKVNFPDRVLAIYIRPVKGKTLPEGINKYITSFDIALHEYNAGRFGYTELRDIADIISRHDSEKEIIPKKSYCPKSGSISVEGVEELILAVKEKVVAICKERKIKTN